MEGLSLHNPLGFREQRVNFKVWGRRACPKEMYSRRATSFYLEDESGEEGKGGDSMKVRPRGGPRGGSFGNEGGRCSRFLKEAFNHKEKGDGRLRVVLARNIE